MIVRVNYENLHLSGDAFTAQFRLRHECFIDRQSYKVGKWRGMEYDQYDTPAATYIVYRGNDGSALGCARLTPLEQGCMLRDLWPHLVADPERAFAGKVLEGTRFCVRKDIPPALHRTVVNELVIGYLEAGLEQGVDRIIGVMPPFIFRSVFIATGCRYSFLGKRARIESGEIIVAAAIEVSEAALAQVRHVTGIVQPASSAERLPELRKAA